MDEVFRYIDDHLMEAVEDLMRLCRQPSVSTQRLGLPEMAELVAQRLGEAGLAVQILPTPNQGPPVVYGELLGDAPTTLLLYNHYDVQPPEPLELWTSPPFEPRLAQGHLYARGAADNKGNIAARLAAVQALLAVRGRLPVSLKWCLEGEEEVGSPNLPAFVHGHRQLLQADACIWEGAGVDWRGRPQIILGAKGILYVELEVRGPTRDVHSSMATVVPNPTWRLLSALGTLKDPQERILIQGFYDEVRPPTEKDLEALAAIPDEEEATLESLGLASFVNGVRGMDYKRRHLFEPTCNICGLVAGYTGEGAKTVLPAVAKAKLDFRLVPEQRPQDILAKLRRHLEAHGFGDIVLSHPMEGEHPARTPVDHPFVALVQRSARQVYGGEPVLLPTMAATGPMYSFTATLGLPVAGVGVEYPDCRMHAPDENIRLADFSLGIKHIAAILEAMRAGPALQDRPAQVK